MSLPKKRRMAKDIARKDAPFEQRKSDAHPLLASLLMIVSFYFFWAFCDYSSTQDFFFADGWLSSLAKTTELHGANACGKLGATSAILLFNLTGFAAFCLPPALGFVAFCLLCHRTHTLFPWKMTLLLAGFFSFVTLLAIFDFSQNDPASLIVALNLADYVPRGAGGTLGAFLYREISYPLLGEIGGILIITLIYAFCLLGLFVDDPRRLIAERIQKIRDYFTERANQRRRRRDALRRDPGSYKNSGKITNATSAGPIVIDPNDENGTGVILGAQSESAGEFDFGNDTDGATSPVEIPDTIEPIADAPTPGKSRKSAPGLIIKGEETVERATGTLAPKTKGDYQLPPITLLKEPPPPEMTPAENYAERAALIVKELEHFKIEVIPGEIQTGPVITRYEVVPASGIRVQKISSLAENLAMALKAESVRVLAPVPGKGTVGIEVPNLNPKAVSLREIIDSKAWQEKKCEIPIVLGKDVTGKPMIADLARMPHCLIAGSTGSGKSVCINGIVASLVYHAGPDDIRFIMVDPKVVELQVYNKLPHMLIPVVTEPKKVPGALKWLISEMERRYQIFAKTGVKNIAGFNAKLSRDHEEAERARQMDLELSPEERHAASQAVEVPRDDGVLEIPDKKLPYIVCFIDELADLMMVAPADIETAIARLAQLARAAGIHLILATQRPSVNVITGIIKANLPCRIAFKVTNIFDSRTILDQKGAEGLLGRGDMLFIPPGASHLVRAQGAFVSEDEIEAIVEDVAKHNGEPEFADDVQEAIELAALEDGEDGTADSNDTDAADDPMITKSWEIIRTTKRASISMLQRKLGIGYGRAARIMDILEERGYVGPSPGPNKEREILRD